MRAHRDFRVYAESIVARPKSALLVALAAVGLLVLVQLGAVQVAALQRLDASILDGFTQLGGPSIDPLARAIAGLCNPDRFVWLAALVVVAALLRRRPRTAAAVLVVLGAANVTTQLLKDVLPSERTSALLAGAGQIPSHSWPSGHATAAMSLALCAVLVAPARWRPWAAAVGAAFAVAVTFSFLSLGWHYPSDVIGGFLVATAWTLLAVALLGWAQARWPQATEAAPPSRRERLALAGVATLSGLLLVALVALARPAQVVAYAQDHTAFVLGAGLIAAAALLLATGVSLLELRVPRRRRG